MCFVIDNDYRNPYIAIKDIKCYKTLLINENNCIISPFQQSPYILNRLYQSKFEYKYTLFIEEGLHSYTSYKDNWIIRCSESLNYYKAIIPSGSKFYYNPIDKEFVSNQIIIKRKLNWFERTFPKLFCKESKPTKNNSYEEN